MRDKLKGIKEQNKVSQRKENHTFKSTGKHDTREDSNNIHTPERWETQRDANLTNETREATHTGLSQ